MLWLSDCLVFKMVLYSACLDRKRICCESHHTASTEAGIFKIDSESTEYRSETEYSAYP